MKKIIVPTFLTTTLLMMGCSENEEVAEGTGTAANENAVQEEMTSEEVEENEGNEEENTDNNGIEEEEEAEEKNEVEEQEPEREFDQDFHDKHDNNELHGLVQEAYEEQLEGTKEMQEENPDGNWPLYIMEEGTEKIYEGEHNTLEYVFIGEAEDDDETHMLYTYKILDNDGDYSISDYDLEIVWE